MKAHQIWWRNLGSGTKKILQIRWYPATNWNYLHDYMIENIYQKEKIVNTLTNK